MQIYVLKATDDGNYAIESSARNAMQLADDLYAHVYNTNNEKVADIKITKPSFNNVNYFSGLSFSTWNGSQLLFNLPFDIADRKVTYKIGKITDNSILNKIKNGDSEGFSLLKKYAGDDSSPLYNETVTINSGNGYKEDGAIIEGTKMSDGAYYYLYAEFDTENGKYIPLTSVTLAKASVYPTVDYHWYLFFYGSKDFNFDGIEDIVTPSDPGSKQPSNLPATGERAIIISLIGITLVVSFVLHKKIKATRIR